LVHSKAEKPEIDAVNASIEAVPPSGIFTFESLKTGYAGVKIGQNGKEKIVRFDNIQ
jgi:hypothetical protein